MSKIMTWVNLYCNNKYIKNTNTQLRGGRTGLPERFDAISCTNSAGSYTSWAGIGTAEKITWKKSVCVVAVIADLFPKNANGSRPMTLETPKPSLRLVHEPVTGTKHYKKYCSTMQHNSNMDSNCHIWVSWASICYMISLVFSRTAQLGLGSRLESEKLHRPREGVKPNSHLH